MRQPEVKLEADTAFSDTLSILRNAYSIDLTETTNQLNAQAVFAFPPDRFSADDLQLFQNQYGVTATTVDGTSNETYCASAQSPCEEGNLDVHNRDRS